MKADWKRNTDPDAEYGSHVADHNGHKLEVYSDRDESQWFYTIDGGDSSSADSKREAMLEAEKEATSP